jgi:hypothetical protein
MPAFDSLGEDPEHLLADYAAQFARLLGWWQEQWPGLALAMEQVAFDWGALRDREISLGTSLRPFRLDLELLQGKLPAAVAERLLTLQKSLALGRLATYEDLLAGYDGERARRLRETVTNRDSADYRVALSEYSTLAGKLATVQQRLALIARIEGTAPGWAEAIDSRSGVHAADTPPGDPVLAWQWCQLDQELQRRAGLDEHELTRTLHRTKDELRRVTAELIDRRAWLGQIRRIDLRARQALQGWAQMQKRIGRGTGKRAPAL